MARSHFVHAKEFVTLKKQNLNNHNTFISKHKTVLKVGKRVELLAVREIVSHYNSKTK